MLLQAVYPKLETEDAPRSSEMMLVALTGVSWHLGAGQALFSPGVAGLHRRVLLLSVPDQLSESRQHARLLGCA